jgi:hypothetical protein
MSGLVASSKGAEAQGDLIFQCGTFADFFAYRTTPSANPGGAAATTAKSTATSDSRRTSQTASSSASSSSQIAATAPASPKSKGVSGALVAGAVVGPICGVALILGLVFLFLRRRRINTPPGTTPTASEAHPQHPPSGYPTSAGSYGEGKELAYVNAGHMSPPIGVPSAGYSPGHDSGAAQVASIHQPNVYGSPPLQNTNPGGYPSPHGGQNVAELPTNSQFTNSPAELPIWSRER